MQNMHNIDVYSIKLGRNNQNRTLAHIHHKNSYANELIAHKFFLLLSNGVELGLVNIMVLIDSIGKQGKHIC